jgi:hypothetical protein
LDSIIRNIYTGIETKDATRLLSGNQAVKRIAIALSDDTDSLRSLYEKLIGLRQQQFFFILPTGKISGKMANEIGRFFFLTNYYYKKDGPQLVHTNAISPDTTEMLSAWCSGQDIQQPHFLLASDFNAIQPDVAGDFIYVSPSDREVFFSVLAEKVVNLDWWSRQIIIKITDDKDAHAVADSLQELSKRIAKENKGIYSVLSTIMQLEGELRKSETVIRFQEIEIANQKLYNNLIRAGMPVPEPPSTTNSNDGQLLNEYNKLRHEYRQMLYDLGRLRNEIAWYKRTYEDRSLMGTIKQKLLQRFKKSSLFL